MLGQALVLVVAYAGVGGDVGGEAVDVLVLLVLPY